jgi:dihydropteroate synthase
MGVVNVTPDSFFDGGRYASAADANAHADALRCEGADILDIGGESTRPGCVAVPAPEQIARIEPVVRHALERDSVVVSVDTTSVEVAKRMLALGAQMINDVSCLSDPELARVTARADAVLVLMHSREPMTELSGYSAYPDDAYQDVVQEVLSEWRAARDRAVAAGMRAENVWLDPGIGFAKNARQSFELLSRLGELTQEGVPVVVGPSRKSFIAAVDGTPPEERLGGTIAACLHAVANGASVLRVHDVKAVKQALLVTRAAAGRPLAEVAHAG